MYDTNLPGRHDAERHRAQPSGICLSVSDAALAKGMLARGDRQHDVAAWFGVNSGRIAEIATGQKFSHVASAPAESLPEPGPYLPRQSISSIRLLLDGFRQILDQAEALLTKSRT